MLEGTVTDPSGAVISGATVQILAVQTKLSQQHATNRQQRKFHSIR
jgi:hypothetical protein